MSPPTTTTTAIGSPTSSDDQDQFMIPRPRLIVPVHTYARKRRTGNLRADGLATGEEDSAGQAAREEGKSMDGW